MLRRNPGTSGLDRCHAWPWRSARRRSDLRLPTSRCSAACRWTTTSKVVSLFASRHARLRFSRSRLGSGFARLPRSHHDTRTARRRCATAARRSSGMASHKRCRSTYATANLFAAMGQSPLVGRVFRDGEDLAGRSARGRAVASLLARRDGQPGRRDRPDPADWPRDRHRGRRAVAGDGIRQHRRDRSLAATQAESRMARATSGTCASSAGCARA